MPRFTAYALLSLFSAVSLGCSFKAQEGAGNMGGGGNTIPPGFDANAPVDRIYTPGDTNPGGGDACPTSSFMANNLPPDLLIVLDRSGSMNEDPITGESTPNSPTNKWAQTTVAINQVVAQTEAKVRWGLKLFASDGGNQSCMVNAMAEVAPGPMNAAAIAAAIGAVMPSSRTPTRAAVNQSAAYLGTVTTANPKFILLATDGEPNCGTSGNQNNSDANGAVQAVTTVAGMGFPVFVIGIATTGGTGDATLSRMAVAGGRPRGMTPEYYPVTTSQSLVDALAIIQGMVTLPCQFQLGGVPSDLGMVTVTVGGQAAPMTDWMYGPGNRSIIFPDAGPTCTGLKSGALKDVIIQLPCGVTVIP